jgi:arylsulfatase A-like enzyme
MPSVIKKSGLENHIVTTDDIFNTCMDFANLSNKSPDGVSFFPVIYGKKMPERPYYLHFPHYSPQHGKPGAVIRSGNYKLIEWYEDGSLELFNLQDDTSENMNLSAIMPEKVLELKQALDTWRNGVGAKMMTPNPIYIPN